MLISPPFFIANANFNANAERHTRTAVTFYQLASEYVDMKPILKG